MCILHWENSPWVGSMLSERLGSRPSRMWSNPCTARARDGSQYQNCWISKQILWEKVRFEPEWKPTRIEFELQKTKQWRSLADASNTCMLFVCRHILFAKLVNLHTIIRELAEVAKKIKKNQSNWTWPDKSVATCYESSMNLSIELNSF